jgi:hypothetical protein
VVYTIVAILFSHQNRNRVPNSVLKAFLEGDPHKPSSHPHPALIRRHLLIKFWALVSNVRRIAENSGISRQLSRNVVRLLQAEGAKALNITH